MDTLTNNHTYYNESCIKCNTCNCMYDITNNSELINMCGDCYLDIYEIDVYGETIETKQSNFVMINHNNTSYCKSPKN